MQHCTIRACRQRCGASLLAKALGGPQELNEALLPVQVTLACRGADAAHSYEVWRQPSWCS